MRWQIRSCTFWQLPFNSLPESVNLWLNIVVILHFLLVLALSVNQWHELTEPHNGYWMVLDYRESLEALRVVVAVAWQGPFSFCPYTTDH